MSVATGSVATAPKPDVLRAADASRVAAIRNSLDLDDAEATAVFGERARREVTASVERLLAEVRGRDVAESAEILQRAAKSIEALEPATLEPRGLFASRAGRLKKFRVAFEEAAAVIEGLEGDLKERGERLARKVRALNALHDQAKTFILELDAYLDAGRACLADGRKAPEPAPALADGEAPVVVEVAPARDPERTQRLERRLGELDAVRAAAVGQLPLVRVVQNVDAPLADRLTETVSALTRWRTDWAELLGLVGVRRGRQLRPDQVGLNETKAAVLKAVRAPAAELEEGRVRRAETEARMEQTAETVRRPG